MNTQQRLITFLLGVLVFVAVVLFYSGSPVRSSESVVMLFRVWNHGDSERVGLGGGSAFYVDDDLIMTARHVVDSEPGKTWTPGPWQVCIEQKLYGAEVVNVSDHDLAVLRVEKKGRPLKIAFPKLGERVAAIGFPNLWQSIVARDIGVRVDRYGKEKKADQAVSEMCADGVIEPLLTFGRIGNVGPNIISFDAAVVQGSSGGPIVNRYGHVVGVAHGLTRDFAVPHNPMIGIRHHFPGQNLAISSVHIRELLRRDCAGRACSR